MPKSFSCEKCHFECCKQSNYSVHLLTPKHEKNEKINGLSTPQNIDTEIQFDCVCGNTYKDRSGLWRHKKKCRLCTDEAGTDISTTKKYSDNDFTKSIIHQLVHQNNILISENQEFMSVFSADNK